MRRRAFLRGVGLAGLGLGAGRVTAHPTPVGGSDGDGTDAAASNTIAPLGRLSLPGALELVTSPDGGTAFVATGEGLAVVAVGEPARPELLAHRTGLLAGGDGTLDHIWDVAVADSRVLVAGSAHADGGPSGFVVFDASDPADVEQVAAHTVETPIHNAQFDGRYAYLTGNGLPGNPLVVVDSETGETVGSWSPLDESERWNGVDRRLWPLHDVWVAGDRAFAAYWDAGTWLLDVSDPAEPTAVSRVRGRSLDALAAVENPAVERTVPPGNDHFVTVGDDGRIVGIGTESWAVEGNGGPGGIEFYDVGVPDRPTRLATIGPPPTSDASRGGVLTTAHNFELSANHCYSAWYQGGLRVHDMSDPTAPREVARWRDTDAAALWTVQRGTDCLVASSTTKLGNTDGEPAVYTFPDPTPARAAGQSAGDTGLGQAGGAIAGGALVALLWRLRESTSN